ncbi:SH3 domain-containing protein [Pseudoruegeria sp. HB172150]|uniref:SH3 domain-containing protein n=1 Tax=Pseudoruegeria sp. HB172150 TaxID=2721164 RepID=UPI001553D1CB|nr:SH3 domain-containing protein [Pseudoruegeria sp. HB172150]
MRRIRTGVTAAVLAVAVAACAAAQERGPVTNLPIPRFVSLKASEANVRRGPSLSHRIDWVFKRRDMPLKIVGEYGHWRRILDRDGMGGWVHYSLLSGVRTVLVEQDMVSLLMKPDPNAPVNATLEAGVVANLDECRLDWCKVEAAGYRGWVPAKAVWGIDKVDMTASAE